LYRTKGIKIKEGAGNGICRRSKRMCATIGSKTELSMAVNDFKTILNEVKN